MRVVPLQEEGWGEFRMHLSHRECDCGDKLRSPGDGTSAPRSPGQAREEGREDGGWMEGWMLPERRAGMLRGVGRGRVHVGALPARAVVSPRSKQVGTRWGLIPLLLVWHAC